MSILKKIHLFLVFILFLGCKKEKISLDGTNIPGDYEWYTSIGGPGEIYSQMDDEVKYGIHINEDGEVLIFKNYERIKETKVRNIYMDPVDGTISIAFENNYMFDLIEDDLNTNDFPLKQFDNQFIKIK